MTVKQSSTTGIINWNSFSVGNKNGVTFDNGSGATLNRVTGGNLSRIAGSLHATGSLYLLNSQGVIVSASGRVVTGGNFVASSGGLSNSAFDDHERRFGNSDAKLIDRGSITAGDEVKLVGSGVTNTGTITGAHIKLRATVGDILAAGTLSATGGVHRSARILIISDSGETKIAGTLNAHNRNGSGGEIETSGRKLSIAGKIDTGKGGIWLVDPENLVVGAAAAKTIDKTLSNGTNVTLKTTKTDATGPGTITNGNGDITIESEVKWSTSATLTLDSYHSLFVDAAVRVVGSGRLALLTDDNGGTGGVLAFNKGYVFFADTKDILGINRQQYRLVSDIATLASDVAAHPNGDYALANSYDASPDGTYKQSPITTGFSGRLEGLGHTISNIEIHDTKASDSIGLFASILASGVVQNLNLSEVDVVGNESVGALAGMNAGLLENDDVSGKVQGDTYVGGMVGSNEGTITMSTSSVTMLDTAGTEMPAETGSLVGDLVGFNMTNGSVSLSSASGNIMATKSSDVGGLVGRNAGVVDASHASGTIRGFNATGGLVGNNETTVEGDSSASGDVYGTRYVGGLVGWNNYGSIHHASASGTVTAASGGRDEGGLVGYLGETGKIAKSHASGAVAGNDIAGGLVGLGEGSISLSFATGAVTGSDELGGLIGENSGAVDQSYATGGVEGLNDLGGFVGENLGADISHSYSKGAVTGRADVGGFAGLNKSSHSTAKILQSYSTGAVAGKKNVGGFLGENAGDLSSAYWDKQTSGLETGIGLIADGGAGKPAGLTTAQFQSGLPAGFDSSIWAESASVNHGLPYLIALAPSR